MSEYIEHAKREFRIAGWVDDEGNYVDNYQQAICENILELLEVLGKQGHSGFSFNYLMGVFPRVASFLPITPLTGDDSEWGTEASSRQNIRCSHIFKDEDGNAYTTRARVFEDAAGGRYTNSDCHEPITFPYEVPDTPEVVLDYPEKENDNE